MSQPDQAGRISRREALKWIAASAATVAFFDARTFGATAAKRYGFDPNLIAPEVTWPRAFTAQQLKTATALSDLIIPADEHSPSASEVNVPDFIDEWISAPYPDQESDRKVILEGFEWLDAESRRRFGKEFASLATEQQSAIADDICHLADAKPAYREAAMFFAGFRNLVAGGYYTTPAGRSDIGYVGNMPLPAFEGPPPEVLRHLGLA